jgi:CheY-specific phosphatase CheX
MLIAEDALCQIIQDTWNSTLGFQVECRASSESIAAGALSVCVKISGAWEGEIRLHCPVPLARSIAAAIYQVDGESASKEEMLDALSELVHIVGGNLKTLLPHPVMLSLPSPSDRGGETVPQTPPQWQLLSRLTLQSQGYAFVVTLQGGPLPGELLEPQITRDSPQPAGRP